MPFTNLYQSSYAAVVVNPNPAALPEELIWSSGGAGTTLSGAAGTIFVDSNGANIITPDLVTPADWYHGGNPLISTNTIQFYDDDLNHITISNSQLDIVSGQLEKGLFELRIGNSLSISSITIGSTTILQLTGSYNFNVNDHIRILGASPTIPDGIYKINVINSLTPLLVEIDYDSSLNPPYTIGGTVEYYEYLWDEVYTTPLGCYQAWDYSGSGPIAASSPYFIVVTNNDSNIIQVYVEDPNIIPKVNDVLVIQKLPNDVLLTNSSTTDGYNSILNFSKGETYQFTITSVSSVVNTYGSNNFIVYTLILDKSFAPIMSTPPTTTLTQYVLVLLNRGGTTTNKELFTDTWEQTEVHRQQLTGDPYNYVGLLSPVGRSNYLNYGGAGFLGVKNLLSSIMPNSNTPFIILQFQDNTKDRINFLTPGQVEVHLPTVILQNEQTPVILSDALATLPVLVDTTGCNRYAPLYHKYPNKSLIRYGWVLYDLRIIVIDYSELAFAMGYNTNRNFTLPQVSLPQAANLYQNSNPSNPLTIVNASSTSPITITTSTPHNFQSGYEVIIQQVLGNTNANSPTNGSYYVDVIDSLNFNLYYDVLLTTPVPNNGTYVNNTGIAYGVKLPYEYFLTYRLTGGHYKTQPCCVVQPFNFQKNGSIDNLSPLSNVQVNVETLSYLRDVNVSEGYEASEWEVILGTYVPDNTNPYTIAGEKDVVVMGLNDLKDLSGAQIVNSNPSLSHQSLITLLDYQNQVASITPSYAYDLTGVNNPNEKIYNVASLPNTLYTALGKWTIGNIYYNQHENQYRLTISILLPAANWNGTTNSSFIPGNNLMSSKLISEIAFLIKDTTGQIVETPIIYAKLSQAVAKNNGSDLNILVNLDF